MKKTILANQNAIRGGRQPITNEKESVNEICNAAASIKQTINDRVNKQGHKMSADERKLQELAIQPPVKRLFRIARIDKNFNNTLKSSLEKLARIYWQYVRARRPSTNSHQSTKEI